MSIALAQVRPRHSVQASTGFRALPALAFILLATPPARQWLEVSMSAHMLVQIPLLVVCGFVVIRSLDGRRQERVLAAMGGAVPCVLLALVASSYWMLPRALDAALGDPLMEIAKFVTLPALVGAPLALAWRSLGLIGRGVVWTNFFSMLAVLGWLYIAAPVRVCNNYSALEQERAGWLMVALALGLFLAWLGALFIGETARADPADAGQSRTSAND
jgi:hypothetical protein